MAKVFFSYSHKDETYRDELDLHLKQLKRNGVIESWHDRCILAGDEIDPSISEQLEAANVIVLLVSHHFLGSDYCNDVELKRALERQEAGEARVIPVILSPCAWHDAPFGKLMAVPTDGRPITKFADRNDGYLEVVTAIKKAVLAMSEGERSAVPAPVATARTASVRPDIRSSNLHVKQRFSDHDKDVFLDDAFEYIRNFFDQSAAELARRHPGIQGKVKPIDANRFTTHLYRDGKAVSKCSIKLGSSLGKSITYSSDVDQHGSFNESFSVGENDTSLFLRSMGMSSRSTSRDAELTMNGAAEQLWSMLIEPLQR